MTAQRHRGAAFAEGHFTQVRLGQQVDQLFDALLIHVDYLPLAHSAGTALPLVCGQCTEPGRQRAKSVYRWGDKCDL